MQQGRIFDIINEMIKEKAEQIIDVLVEMGIIELIPFGNKVKSLVKTANKLYRIVRD